MGNHISTVTGMPSWPNDTTDGPTSIDISIPFPLSFFLGFGPIIIESGYIDSNTNTSSSNGSSPYSSESSSESSSSSSTSGLLTLGFVRTLPLALPYINSNASH